MVTITSGQLRKASRVVRAAARQAPVTVTYHGWPELVVMSVADYALLRGGRRSASRRDDMAPAKIDRIAGNRMPDQPRNLDAAYAEC